MYLSRLRVMAKAPCMKRQLFSTHTKTAMLDRSCMLVRKLSGWGNCSCGKRMESHTRGGPTGRQSIKLACLHKSQIRCESITLVIRMAEFGDKRQDATGPFLGDKLCFIHPVTVVQLCKMQ